MANRSILYKTAMVLTFLATSPGTLAQSRERVRAAESISGISTDRLTLKQLRIWREIEQIAVAADKAGRPLHPRLHSLRQWAKGGGHNITIEMADRRVSTFIAGSFTMEQGHSNGLRGAAILWLHLWAIDNALVDPVVHRSDGLIPFYGLGTYERYAEVVGHELTHAFLMLENPEYARLCSEMLMAADEFLLSGQQSMNGAAHDDMIGQRQVWLQSMYDKIEGPAEAAEKSGVSCAMAGVRELVQAPVWIPAGQLYSWIVERQLTSGRTLERRQAIYPAPTLRGPH
jgi:hypothetical protein